MLLRSLNIRRLSFVLFSAERNHFLLQLPSIQERLVELLRTNIVSPMVHSEVYLCLRVLICRVAPRELSNLWPIILTELVSRRRGKGNLVCRTDQHSCLATSSASSSS